LWSWILWISVVTDWLLEKLIVAQLVIFPAFCGTQMFITVITGAHYWSLSWARLIQFTPSCFVPFRSTVIILPSMARSSKWSFPSGSPTRTLYTFPFSPVHVTCYLILLELIIQRLFGKVYKLLSFSLFNFCQTAINSCPFDHIL
jgi:hypothetical protein